MQLPVRELVGPGGSSGRRQLACPTLLRRELGSLVSDREPAAWCGLRVGLVDRGAY